MSVQGLTDSARLDPYAPKNEPHSRQVMISIFFPVDEAKTPCVAWERVPYMTPLVAEAYDELGTAVGLPNGTFSAFKMESCQPRVLSCRRSRSNFPLVLFSPGSGNPRLLYGAMAREVASHGFAVVTIDHPYDSSFVEFPDGTVYEANPVPGIDVDRTIMFGHSLGGATAAAAMLTDTRIRGAINFDGKLLNPVLEAGLDRPFALVGRPGHVNQDPTWDEFYTGLRGPSVLLSVAGTTHASFTDFPTLISSLNLTLPEATKSLLETELGTLKFGKIGNVVAGVVSAFANLSLDKQVEPLFTKEGDAAFPEVSVQESSF
ncbi:putative 1-alkyl-2-acetylglycerophosphocholine esterase [Colletotrichum spaethianum]|uniref:1-alkyl-2-acetylglycerophosphocholine esterase n=1 Tax=Colletotrichum spaethianum TaxID=700344 RepID=A0AA37LH31_9PEZI|nr:putative 1-alkyl-2-acetylglycerophosphocholine esterase [Colletotrichum spaethianum]GKT47364.1 putative 1-alkyl-2-acetylglycerophosphocholine esterase [Colletotrichum spaethianum]